MIYKTRRFLRLATMLIGGVITPQNFRHAMSYPVITVTGRHGVQRYCCSTAVRNNR